jgi:hypothetical protein
MTSTGAPSPRYLWIRLALFEKQLAIIIDYLVQNSRYGNTDLKQETIYQHFIALIVAKERYVEQVSHKQTSTQAKRIILKHKGGHVLF